MKKVLSIVLAVVIACSIGLVSVLAENEPILVVKSDVASASVGDEVIIRVNLAENSNLGVLTFDLKYDTESFEYVTESVVLGNIFPAGEINPDLEGCIRFTGITTTSVNEGGSLLAAKFKVLKTGGEFNLVVEEACDGEDNDVTSAVAEDAVSSVVVECAHSNTVEEIIEEATCTVEGTLVIACADCGKELAKELIPVSEHNFGEWVVSKEATCVEQGEVKRVCVCGVEETRPTEVAGHTSDEWNVVKEATCTEDGLMKAVCTVCNKEVEEVIEAEGHKYGESEIVKDATCTSDGLRKVICEVCGNVQEETIEALGHVYSDVEVVKEATCTEDGLTKTVCTVCDDEVEEVIKAEGHKYGEAEVIKEATCVDDGVKQTVCENCGDTTKEVIYAKGHSFGEWVVTKEATADEEGLMERVCESCDEVESKAINKLDSEIVGDPEIPNTDSISNDVSYGFIFALFGVGLGCLFVGIFGLRKKKCK